MSASIEIGIQELLLSGKGTNTSSARNVKVRVQLPNDVVTHALETAPVNIINQAQPVRFDWAHHVPLTERGRSWEALKKALDLARVKPGAARVEYHLINASSGAELGARSLRHACAAARACLGPHVVCIYIYIYQYIYMYTFFFKINCPGLI